MKGRRQAGTGLCLFCLIGTAACGGDAAADGVEASVRDSAGISIVENVARPDAAPVLQLSAEPAVRIGALEGAAEYLLDNVQHVTRLSDGTIVVANGGSQELRYYDAAGEHVRTVGGTGEGPGEYRTISYMRRLAGDSLLIFDSRNRRLTILDAAGSHSRNESTLQDGTAMGVQAALEDGTLLIQVSKTRITPESVEMARDTVYFEVVGNAAATRLPYEYQGGERSMTVNSADGQIFGIQIRTVAYARNRVVAAGRDMFVVGSTDTYELHVADGTGTVHTIVRRPDVQPQPITDELIDAWHEWQLEMQRADGREVSEADAATRRSQLQAQTRVAGTPAYERVVAAQDGGFWVEDFAPPASGSEVERWSVYAEDGRMRGVVDVPTGFRVLHVDDDVVIGVMRDEFEVEYVHVYELVEA